MSNILNNRSAEAKPSCSTAFNPAKLFSGLYARKNAVRKEKKVPGVVSPSMTLIPPYRTTPATAIPPSVSIIGRRIVLRLELLKINLVISSI